MFLSSLLVVCAAGAPSPAGVLAPPGLQDVDLPVVPVREDVPKRMRLSFLLGRRALDEDYWEPLDDQIALEAILEWRPSESPFGAEFGMAFGYDDATIAGVEVSHSTFELYGGVRATLDLFDGALQPYGSFGPSFLLSDLSAEQSGFTVSDDDWSFGLYARAGVAFVFGNGFALGLDYRKLFATDISLFGAEGDSDFDQFGITFGFSF